MDWLAAWLVTGVFMSDELRAPRRWVQLGRARDGKLVSDGKASGIGGARTAKCWCVIIACSIAVRLAMLCYAMLCYAVLCCAVLCCAMLCYAMLC